MTCSGLFCFLYKCFKYTNNAKSLIIISEEVLPTEQSPRYVLAGLFSSFASIAKKESLYDKPFGGNYIIFLLYNTFICLSAFFTVAVEAIILGFPP